MLRQPHWVDANVQKTLSLFTQSVPGNLNELKKLPSWAVIELLEEIWVKSPRLSPYLQPMGKNNFQGTVRAMSMFAAFEIQGGAPIYKIGEEFGAALLKADCKVSANYLPFDNVIRCIELPEKMTFDMQDGDSTSVCYIGSFSPRIGIDYIIDTEVFHRRIEILVPIYNKDGDNYGHDNIRLFLKDEDTIEQAIVRSFEQFAHCGVRTGFSRGLIEYVLKCLVYIHSGDPDLREFRPTPKPESKAKPKHQRRWLRENFFPIPITLIGFDYKKPRQMSVDSTWIDTFQRWQPYGPNLSKVKLIWVKPHERHYHKDGVLK